MTPADTVGLFPPFQWVLNSLSRWIAPFFGAAATLGLLFVLAAGVEGRLLDLRIQYMGVWPGDGFLSLSLAASIIGVLFYFPYWIYGWWQARWWHWCALGVGLGLVSLLKGAEIYATLAAPGKPGVYSWGQHLSPQMLGHTIIVPVMAYLVLTVGAAVLWSPTVPWWLKAVVIGGVLGWATCSLVLDNTLPRPDVDLIHVTDGWWWQRDHFWR